MSDTVDPPTEPFAAQSDPAPATPVRRRRGPSAPTVVRTLSGVTVLAVLATATWVAGDQRTVLVSESNASRAAVVQGAPAAAGAPSVAGPAAKPSTPATPAAPAGPAPGAAVPITPGGGGATLPSAVVPPGGATSPGASTPLGAGGAGAATTPGGATALDPATSAFSAPAVDTQPPCPLGLPEPAKSGGLSSIVELSPMFGPFASEVFSLGPAIQPMMQLAGPLLAELEPVIHQNLPWITPILNGIAGAGEVVLAAILPFYGPYRDQFIASEGKFAASIAPVLTATYDSPAAACLTAVQGELIRQAHGGQVTAPSLTRPGQVVRLGPKG
ncbi:hypothetical protein [Williamsia deligens]|uniref:Uncharacterized protein n=1 Tax=Williamsia deligens TaxID=321325 RepID=A0ABW3G1L7_9NOCA|nr:hypothetical protein [Williamsia deligens]MCP2194855.1 hypothetical protein [Williamsia deligens]